jgi:hypothetical protein
MRFNTNTIVMQYNTIQYNTIQESPIYGSITWRIADSISEGESMYVYCNSKLEAALREDGGSSLDL